LLRCLGAYIGVLRAIGKIRFVSYGNILDEYVRSAPSPQNAVDIFKGQWLSSFPSRPDQAITAGSIPLFEDPRITWALERLDGASGKKILELGPLEGGHSYMLEERGASSVIAIEGNTRAYLKCLIAKEVLQMKRVSYLCGDFVQYLKATSEQFDLIVASGVLYHMQKPLELLSLLAAHTNRLYLWTHYFDPLVREGANRNRFPSQTECVEAGFPHTLYRFEYQTTLESPQFCGGNEEYSNWLSREDLLGSLRHLGFEHLVIGLEQRDHPHGPSLALVATKGGQ
jgi:Protein of unknown function (DUF1698)